MTLAFLPADGMEIQMQHYAFLVSDAEFDQIFGRIKERKLKYWADPGQKQEGKTNTHFGGRGVYFEDPSGHLLEIITRPYGNWPAVTSEAGQCFTIGARGVSANPPDFARRGIPRSRRDSRRRSCRT